MRCTSKVAQTRWRSKDEDLTKSRWSRSGKRNNAEEEVIEEVTSILTHSSFGNAQAKCSTLRGLLRKSGKRSSLGECDRGGGPAHGGCAPAVAGPLRRSLPRPAAAIIGGSMSGRATFLCGEHRNGCLFGEFDPKSGTWGVALSGRIGGLGRDGNGSERMDRSPCG